MKKARKIFFRAFPPPPWAIQFSTLPPWADDSATLQCEDNALCQGRCVSCIGRFPENTVGKIGGQTAPRSSLQHPSNTLNIEVWNAPRNIARMTLDEGQRRKVAEWIEQGLKLSEIQDKLAADLGVRMTYMEVRFLIDDLKLRPKDTQPVATVAIAPEKQTAPGKTATPSPAPSPLTTGQSAVTSSVSVTVDQIARAGALVSGKVTFTDGQSAEWYLDQAGRLGLAPMAQGYRPPQADIAEFQRQLQEELARMGF